MSDQKNSGPAGKPMPIWQMAMTVEEAAVGLRLRITRMFITPGGGQAGGEVSVHVGKAGHVPFLEAMELLGALGVREVATQDLVGDAGPFGTSKGYGTALPGVRLTVFYEARALGLTNHSAGCCCLAC